MSVFEERIKEIQNHTSALNSYGTVTGRLKFYTQMIEEYKKADFPPHDGHDHCRVCNAPLHKNSSMTNKKYCSDICRGKVAQAMSNMSRMEKRGACLTCAGVIPKGKHYYCSSKCTPDKEKTKNQKREEKLHMECKECGKKFKAKNLSTKYCSKKCASKHARRNHEKGIYEEDFNRGNRIREGRERNEKMMNCDVECLLKEFGDTE